MWYYMYPDTASVNDLPYYLYSLGLHELQPRISRPEGAEYDQFFYGTRGSGVLLLNGQYHAVPAGDGFFIPAKVPHEYYPSGNIWDLRWMSPRGYGLSHLYQKLGLNGGVYRLWNVTGLEIQMNKMREELLNHETYGIYYASSHVQEYIMEFAKQSGVLRTNAQHRLSLAPHSETIYEQHMNLIKDYLSFHYMKPVTVTELCALVGVTPQHLSRITRSCCGMRPVEYLNHIRISKAKEFLGFTQLNTCEIARKCGFENDNYFWRTFKNQTGLTPGEYRRRYRSSP